MHNKMVKRKISHEQFLQHIQFSNSSTIASTHCVTNEGMVGLSWPWWLIPRSCTCNSLSHICANRLNTKKLRRRAQCCYLLLLSQITKHEQKKKMNLSMSCFLCESSALSVASESRSVFNSTSRATFSRDLSAASDSQRDFMSDISLWSLEHSSVT